MKGAVAPWLCSYIDLPIGSVVGKQRPTNCQQLQPTVGSTNMLDKQMHSSAVKMETYIVAKNANAMQRFPDERHFSLEYIR